MARWALLWVRSSSCKMLFAFVTRDLRFESSQRQILKFYCHQIYCAAGSSYISLVQIKVLNFSKKLFPKYLSKQIETYSKKWTIPGLFSLFSSFHSTVDSKQMFNINIIFADDWIQTGDLWYRKRPLYQLSHNHSHKTYSMYR